MYTIYLKKGIGVQDVTPDVKDGCETVIITRRYHTDSNGFILLKGVTRFKTVRIPPDNIKMITEWGDK